MSDQAREFFSDLPQRSTGVVDLAARSAPAQARLKIGKTPAESDGFRRLLGIDQREEAVQPVLERAVVSEARFGSPVAAAGQITDGAAVQRVDISPRVIDVVAGNQAVRLAAVIRDRQTAVRRQDDVALGVEVVVGANLTIGGGVSSHRRTGRGGLIGQRERLQGEPILGYGIRQLFADGGGRNVALNEAGRRQPVALVVSENKDPVLFDCAAKRPSELIESEMGLDGNGL